MAAAPLAQHHFRLVVEVAGCEGVTGWLECWGCDVTLTSDAQKAKHLRRAYQALAKAQAAEQRAQDKATEAAMSARQVKEDLAEATTQLLSTGVVSSAKVPDTHAAGERLRAELAKRVQEAGW